MFFPKCLYMAGIVVFLMFVPLDLTVLQHSHVFRFLLCYMCVYGIVFYM